MSLFAAEGDGWRHEPERGDARRLVCRAGNPFGLPAKDRSGRLDSPSRRTSARCSQRSTQPRKDEDHDFDMNDAEPQKTGELIPDGTFAKVTMIIRPGGIDGQSRDRPGPAQGPEGSHQRCADARLRVHRGRGPARQAQVLADVHRPGRQGRRERRLDRLEDLEEHLPRHDRQRARARSRRT